MEVDRTQVKQVFRRLSAFHSVIYKILKACYNALAVKNCCKRGHSTLVVHQLPKLVRRVRFRKEGDSRLRVTFFFCTPGFLLITDDNPNKKMKASDKILNAFFCSQLCIVIKEQDGLAVRNTA